MKTETKTTTIQGSLSGKSVTMGVRNEDMGAIMAILTDLYSDALAAVIREYSCNALDAHKEAGSTLPIEISTPTRFAPALMIRDYGVGMDADTIEQVYAQYGRSTKRESNEQIGGFGIGCKSGLSYSDQFTVTSIKDGKKVVVLVSRDENERGSMEILNMPPDAPADWLGEDTQEGNGTAVSIPVRADDTHRVADLIADFFQYWSPGTVLVDGDAPEYFAARQGVLKVSDTLFIDTNSRYHRDRIVMGGVSYPALDAHKIARPTRLRRVLNYAVIALVDIGTCTPHPSRERLRDTRNTVDTIERIGANLEADMTGAAQREINKAATHSEALQVASIWRKYGPDTLTYKGDDLPGPFRATVKASSDRPYGSPSVDLIKVTKDYYDKRSGVIAYNEIDSHMWPRLVWVTGFEPKNVTEIHREKLLKWAGDNIDQFCVTSSVSDGPVDHFALLRVGDSIDSPFIDPSRVVDWDTIKAIKLPHRTSGSSYSGPARLRGSYDTHTESGPEKEVPATDIDTTKPLAYTTGNRHTAANLASKLSVLLPEYTLVHMSTNRVQKFRRNFPTAVPVFDLIKTGIDKWKKKWPQRDHQAWQMHADGRAAAYVNLDPARVDDPEVVAAIHLAKRDVSALVKETNKLAMILVPTVYPDPLKWYALYQRLSITDETYVYLNAVYAARQNGTLT